MLSTRVQVRHVVARLFALRMITCLLLWSVCLVALVPALDLPLRDVALLGVASAAGRLLVVLAMRRQNPVPQTLLGVSLVCDALLLTGLLDITGGPFNPFIVMYGVYVWLAVLTASPRWGLLTGTLSAGGFAWLVFDHLRAEQAQHHRLNDFPTHLFTMWIALTAIAELVAHYVAASAAAFEAQERAVEDARERAARSERRAALMAMAAGAAHELSTPLATIAVAARELDLTAGRLVLAAAHHSVDGGSGQSADVAALRDDARLIRSEVDRCQVVLDAMTGRATSGVLADDTPLTIESLVARARERLPEADRRRLKVDLVVAGIVLPNGAEAVQAIAVLLKNAFDASAPHDDVTLRIVRNQDALRIEVADCGPGMSPDVLKRVGEPFYTTKEAGRGVGLGLFLARGFAERMRGSLEFVIRDGTTAIMEIPLDRAGAGV